MNYGRPDIGMSRGTANFDDATNMENNYESIKKTKRPEMKGPANIKDILSGLKTKKINLKDDTSGSVASVHDLEELSKTNLGKPKKSRRKKSERNVVHLSI
jgi:hypothetical protein